MDRSGCGRTHRPQKLASRHTRAVRQPERARQSVDSCLGWFRRVYCDGRRRHQQVRQLMTVDIRQMEQRTAENVQPPREQVFTLRPSSPRTGVARSMRSWC